MLQKLIIVIVLISAYFAAVHFSGGALYDFGLPLGGERGVVRKLVNAFWEDIQFKDFQKAGSYHAPQKRKTVDIPYLLARLFMQKPEALDIMDYEIVFCKIDSTSKRARVKSRIKVKDLVRKEIRSQEAVLYLQRESLQAPWYMVLEDSLRKLEADKQKKH